MHLKSDLLKAGTFRSNLITYGLIVVFYLVLQGLNMTGNLSSLMEGLLVPFCYYMILAVSLNLVVGISGELSLGHAGFMCVGAFSSAIFASLTADILPGAVELVLAILIGAIVGGVFGFLIGIPVLRLRGDYLAIVTLAFGEIIKNVINAIYLGVDENGFHISLRDSRSLGLTEDGTIIIKGAQGIGGLPRNATFTAGIILLLITVFIVLNLTNSRTGRAIMATRDNRIAAESTGLKVSKLKMTAFVISAALAGAAGVLYSHNLANLQSTSKNFGYNQSILILVFVVLGGIGNIRGSMIAAVILTLLPERLRFLSNYRMLIYAVVLILMMIFSSAPRLVEWRKRLKESLLAGRRGTRGGTGESGATDGASVVAAQPTDRTSVVATQPTDRTSETKTQSTDDDESRGRR